MKTTNRTRNDRVAPDPEPIALLRQLVAIDSVNPDLIPGAAGEPAIAGFCAGWLADRGFEVHLLERVPGRPSVVGIARGTGGGGSLMLNGHLDTVGVAGFEGDPFALSSRAGGADTTRADATGVNGAEAGAAGVETDPETRDAADDRLYGRGTFDMKGGVAAIMVAAATATADPEALAGDVLVTLVADEEVGSIGTEEVLEAFTADAAIVAEPTEGHIVLSHRGFAWFEITLTGVAAHGSMPEKGVDAIAHAFLVMRSLDALRGRLEAAEPHPLLGHGTVRVSMIQGGQDAATVASECRLTIERRTLPGETPDAVESQLRELLEECASETEGFTFALRHIVARGGFEVSPETSIAQTVMREAERVYRQPAPIRGEPFWTDAGLIAEAGIPCLLIGVDGNGAHAVDEHTTRRSVLELTDILTGTIRAFCAN